MCVWTEIAPCEQNFDCAPANESGTRAPRTPKRIRLRAQTALYGDPLYTEPGCNACVEAKNFLTSRGVRFEERDVCAHQEFRQTLTDDLDSCTLPTLVAGDTIIVGFDREEYRRLPARATKEKRR